MWARDTSQFLIGPPFKCSHLFRRWYIYSNFAYCIYYSEGHSGNPIRHRLERKSNKEIKICIHVALTTNGSPYFGAHSDTYSAWELALYPVHIRAHTHTRRPLPSFSCPPTLRPRPSRHLRMRELFSAHRLVFQNKAMTTPSRPDQYFEVPSRRTK